MTHVTPQTAAALKAAGFPQPLQTPAVGQVWYDTAGTPYQITAADGERCDYVVGETLFIDRYLNGGEVFAPAAEDILRAMPSISARYDAVKKAFVCEIAGVWGAWGKSHHESLPEALALAYLNAHNPK